MSTGALISKYVPFEVQVSLLSDLVENGRFKEALDLLDTTSIDITGSSGIPERIFERINNILPVRAQVGDLELNCDDLIKDDELRTFAQLICKVASIWDLFESWISSELIDYVNRKKRWLFEKGDYENVLPLLTEVEKLSVAEEDESESDSVVIMLLVFLEVVYLFSSDSIELVSPRLDRILMVLMGCDNEMIASKCSALMRWHMKDIAKRCCTDTNFDRSTWDLVDRILGDGSTFSWKQRNGLSFLLRFLTTSDLTPNLVNFIRTKAYWEHIQASLCHNVHEYRKLGLSILKLTIQKIPDSVNSFHTTLFSWDPAQGSQITQTWKDFTTLYEIVALDTALNQIEAASGDILRLLENEILSPTWGLLLFSTGLKASMESVRKYMVSLLFQVRRKNVFSTDLKALQSIFLPSMMEAHFFNSDGQTCTYGEWLSQFISEMVSESDDSASRVVQALLETLVNQGNSFDPARIYLSLGVLNSLRKRNQRLVTSSHLQLIRKLFEFENEDAVFEATNQTIYLKYLLHVSPAIASVEWLQSIISHIKCGENSYRYFSPLMDLFKDFVLTYFEKGLAEWEIAPHIGKDETFDFLSFILFDYKNVPITHKLLLEAARSGENLPDFTPKAAEYLNVLLSGDDSIAYEGSAVLVEYSGFNTSTWKSVDLEPLFSSILNRFSAEKFKFFVATYKKVYENTINLLEVSWSQLKTLYESIKENLSDCSLTSFKVKDEIYGVYFEFLALALRSSTLSEDGGIDRIVGLLEENVHHDNGNFSGNLRVSELCTYLLATYVTTKGSSEAWNFVNRIFDLLTAIWDSFSSERLVLKQRNLHLSTINGIFHPTVLLYATFPSGAGLHLANKLQDYGERVIEQAYSRRGVLPLMGRNINAFIQMYGKKLEEINTDYWWLVNIMISVSVCSQIDVNIFKIKPVIADLFDKKIGTYQGDRGLYERTYGAEELSAKIAIISAIIRSPHAFKKHFIAKTFECTNLLVARKRTDGAEEIQRLLKWQLVVLTIKAQDKARLLDIAIKVVLPNLVEEISPVIRVYMEWTIALALSENYGDESARILEDKLFSLMDDHSRPIVVVSAERVIFLVLRALASMRSAGLTQLLNKFTIFLIPNATSNKPLVRHFSNSLMLSFWPSFQHLIKDPTLKGILKQLYDKAEDTKMSGRYRAGDANFWDIHDDLTLTGIFGGVLKKTIDHSLPYISRKKFIKYLLVEETSLVGEDETSLWLSKRVSNRKETRSLEVESDDPSQLQTKSGAWETLMDIDNDSPDKNVKRSDLIVVASLVDKPPNLGGICRLCDVLGVGLLTVHDIRVTKNPQYKNVAVTADRWMPVTEVPVQGIIDFMKQKKQEGYAIIGLEQTDKSVQLDADFKFPRKSLILLGTEAHGIPGNLLCHLDLCLEIKQFGVIRSMNIQTATAVIVHSYTIQHM